MIEEPETESAWNNTSLPDSIISHPSGQSCGISEMTFGQFAGSTAPSDPDRESSLVINPFSIFWSPQEQRELEEGLIKYSGETRFMCYVKIAATLPGKTVRDVALRCKLMRKKRRKLEERKVEERNNSRKDTWAETPQLVHMSAAFQLNGAACYLGLNSNLSTDSLCFEGLSSKICHLLDLNFQTLSQIASNLSACELQDNIALFRCTGDNIAVILDDLARLPSAAHMPPLPVSVNKDLLNAIMAANSSQFMCEECDGNTGHFGGPQTY